jgi:hypothetical protein
MDKIPEGEGVLIRKRSHSTVNKYASLETKRGIPEGYRTYARKVSNAPILIHWAASTWPPLYTRKGVKR